MFFFVISGFLISYVLEKKYPANTESTYKFYKSRAIRIYSLYWVMYLFSALVINPECVHKIWSSGPLNYLPSLFLFGVDWRVSFGDYPHEYYGLFPIGLNQAWTLGSEMAFYLIAPFVLRSLTATLVLLIMSAMVRAALVHVFGFFESWTYHFFPSIILFFLLGHLSRVVHNKIRLPNKVGIGFLGLAIFFMMLSVNRIFDSPYFYLGIVSFALSLPYVFELTKNNRILNFLGDTSYAIYLIHVMIIVYIWPLISPHIPFIAISNHPKFVFACIQTAIIVCIAIGIGILVEIIVEKHVASVFRKIWGLAEQKIARACIIN